MEILKTINNPEKRQKIVDAINQGVAIRHSLEQSKEDLKEIGQFLKEDFEVPTAEYNKVVDAVYRNNITELKQKVLDIESVVDIVANTEQDSF